MKIKILATGKTKQDFVQDGLDEYLKRLRKYTTVEWIEWPDVKKAAALPPQERNQREGDRILEKLDPSDHVVLLDEKGREYTSVGFADQLETWSARHISRLVFVIGGPYGFSEEVCRRANEKIALSQMTFSHQMVRLFFAEQLYRAYTIRNNESYHHA